MTAILALLLALLSGCAPTMISPIAPEGPARDWSAGELISALSERSKQLRSLRALARVDYLGPDGRNGFQEAVLVERPDRLRLETLSFLGAILIVTANGSEIVGHHTREGVFLRGEASKENVLRLTQIPLELDEVTALLLGLPPVDIGAAARQEGATVIVDAANGEKDVVRFYGDEKVPTQWQRSNGSGTVELSASFSDYTTTPAGSFASRIVLESAAPKRRLEIRYQEPEVNGDIPPELFSQQKPPHAKELPIEVLAR
jgi:hypothetical protein